MKTNNPEKDGTQGCHCVVENAEKYLLSFAVEHFTRNVHVRGDVRKWSRMIDIAVATTITFSLNISISFEWEM